jgi:hypothetical protein
MMERVFGNHSGGRMRIKKTIVDIGKIPYTIIQFNYTPPKDKNVLTDKIHLMEVFDKNQAITGYSDEFIEKIKKTNNLMEAREAAYEYLSMFKDYFKIVEHISAETIHIKCEGKSILYLTRKSLRLEKDSLNTNLYKSINRFYIISPQSEEFEFTVNDEVFDSSKIKRTLTSLEVKSLMYALAYENYYNGNAEKALDILSLSLRDKYLSRLILNSFTAKERQRCSEVLLLASHNKKLKLQSRMWTPARLAEGEIIDNEGMENGPCFMELLGVLERNGDKFIPVTSEQYKRIGHKVIDHYNAFKGEEGVKLAADFRNLVFSKERLNISIRYTVPGFITINPRQAKAAGFNSNVFKARVYREQTIIKDGDINIDKFMAFVSKDTLEYLEGLKVKGLFEISEKKHSIYENYTLVEMNISKLPVLNRSFVINSDSLDYILDTYYEQRKAECMQKVTRYFIEQCLGNVCCKPLIYTREQYQLLKDYGLDANGIYQGIDNKVENEGREPYEWRLFEFGLKGFSNLPKVEELLIKMSEDKKKLNRPEIIMVKYIIYLRRNGLDYNINELKNLLEEQKSIIRKNTRILAQVKLAKTLTGSWWRGLKLDDRDNYIYERNDNTLVIKVIKKAI